MKAIELREFGIGGARVVDRAIPSPGAGQVLVQMRAFSLNYRDLMTVEGTYNPKLKLPMVPLSDGAGEVAEVGEGVHRFRVGDRVAGIFMQHWLSGPVDEQKAKSALGGAVEGVAAEYVVFDQDGLVSLPDYLNYSEAACLPCAGVTAWHALVSSAHLRPACTVLTQGTGGVSLFAMQIARLRSADVIATSGSEAKIERLKGMDLLGTVNYKHHPDWDVPVREMTGGAGADHVVEVGGSGTLATSMKAVKMGGTISVIGVLSGRDTIGFVPILSRSIRLQGIYVGSREMFEEMLNAFELHNVHPVIDRTFGLDDFQGALEYMKSGGHFGKICLQV